MVFIIRFVITKRPLDFNTCKTLQNLSPDAIESKVKKFVTKFKSNKAHLHPRTKLYEAKPKQVSCDNKQYKPFSADEFVKESVRD
jgi:hypothetical protein